MAGGRGASERERDRRERERERESTERERERERESAKNTFGKTTKQNRVKPYAYNPAVLTCILHLIFCIDTTKTSDSNCTSKTRVRQVSLRPHILVS